MPRVPSSAAGILQSEASILAPIDKLRAGGNDIMQIEVTRKCSIFSCSNCSRALPFRRDTIEMSLAVFREAVDSLDGWTGVVALFGGNPCNHNRFADLCAILTERVPPERRGLWANDLMEHGAIAAETFRRGRLNLNAHADERAAAEIDRWFPGQLIEKSRRHQAWHGAILVDRRDLGVSDGDWETMREACDINRHWSGIIVEREGRPYGYFCEVAATLDGVRRENHGVLAAPGWWREPMETFEQQVRGCCDRGCGVPLRMRGHLDRADVYDVSSSWAAEIGTRGRRYPVGAQVHEDLGDRSHELTDYMGYRAPKRSA
jgi:hypothetical protein